MNTDTGDVYKSLQDAVDDGVDEEKLIPVEPEEMTPKQMKRMEENDQPVVRRADTRSKLAKRRAKHQRYLERKRKRREGNRKAGSVRS